MLNYQRAINGWSPVAGQSPSSREAWMLCEADTWRAGELMVETVFPCFHPTHGRGCFRHQIQSGHMIPKNNTKNPKFWYFSVWEKDPKWILSTVWLLNGFLVQCFLRILNGITHPKWTINGITHPKWTIQRCPGPAVTELPVETALQRWRAGRWASVG